MPSLSGIVRPAEVWGILRKELVWGKYRTSGNWKVR